MLTGIVNPLSLINFIALERDYSNPITFILLLPESHYPALLSLNNIDFIEFIDCTNNIGDTTTPTPDNFLDYLIHTSHSPSKNWTSSLNPGWLQSKPSTTTKTKLCLIYSLKYSNLLYSFPYSLGLSIHYLIEFPGNLTTL